MVAKNQLSAMDSLLAIEAMRLGVVPNGKLIAHTVGRKEELSNVSADLQLTDNNGGALRAFLGEYGTGKSHLLQLVQEMALQNNFLVSSVVLDSTEIAPAYPKRVYRSIVHNLQYPGDPTLKGLRPLLEKALETPEALKSFRVGKLRNSSKAEEYISDGAHLYITPVLSYLKTFNGKKPRLRKTKNQDTSQPIETWLQERQQLLIDFLEGHPAYANADIYNQISPILGCSARIYSLADYRPWAKIYGYLLNGLSTLAKQVGYAGMAIVIDEAEFYALLSTQNRMFAQFLFKSLAHAASGTYEQQLPFKQDELLKGGAGIQRTLSARYSDNAGLYLVFAMTPNSEGIRVLHDAIPPHLICNLNELSANDYQQIVDNVCALYRSAYGTETIPEALDAPLANVVATLIEQGQCNNPREAMKFLTDFLDIVRYTPDRIGEVIENMRYNDTF